MTPLRFTLVLVALLLPPALLAQDTFDLQAYREFLAAHRQLSAAGIMQLHPAGTFSPAVPTTARVPEFLELIRSRYGLTAYEESLLVRHDFVVTERIQPPTFGQAFLSLWQADLPVFISSDALLHAIHRSYDAILLDVERQSLLRMLDGILASMHGELPAAATRYAGLPGMQASLLDVDLYCTVARRLLGRPVQPVFLSQGPAVDSLLNAIEDAKVLPWSLFATTPRIVDFSQFTPRGHYAQSDSLKRYFQAMMWLGRTELYLIPPRSADRKPTDGEIQRQTIDALLLAELASAASASVDAMERTIRMFVGEQDNVTLGQLAAVAAAAGISSAGDLADTIAWRAFQKALLVEPFAFQRINSQILMTDPASTDALRPASAFLLFGQRFVVDSYVFCNVVYDRVRSVPFRMIPSSLDVLAALGNDAALQLLQPELEKYSYAPQLAALRYLIDGYDPLFWRSSLYNGWLHAVRALNPPLQRDRYPAFMQTAAWWQHAMSTQLASWAELRHDNLLYAKQSYTGGVICSYPEAYLEPVPELYRRVKEYADAAHAALSDVLPGMTRALAYFRALAVVGDTLAGIAAKELAGTPLDYAEQGFLRRILYQTDTMCGAPPDGWYVRIHYTGAQMMDTRDLVVADVHTVPTDEFGSMVGWVIHAGTGPVNLAVIRTSLPGGRVAAFAGPVMSYYEHMTSGFKRLTDDEWAKAYGQAPSVRPAMVNLYLANAAGGTRGSGPMLLTGVDPPDPPPAVPQQVELSTGFPNPFNGETTLHVYVPQRQGTVDVDVSIVSVQGQHVRSLFRGPLVSGTYGVRWDGTNERGGPAASGVYMALLRSGGGIQVRKLVLIR